jgi:hypothetical protein
MSGELIHKSEGLLESLISLTSSSAQAVSEQTFPMHWVQGLVPGVLQVRN